MVEGFGKYEVRGLLGEGGFGKVYRGWDPDLKREVAIKTCSFSEERLRKRFVQEAEVAAGLRHPNIVTVHDFGAEDGEPYLVQDLLEGEDLDVLIAEGRTGDLETKLDWLRQVAEGLRHAHERDVVHRDVKPANVRVSPDGRVRILDFGIAKVLTAEEELTRTGMSLGTAGYVSPEQLRDLEIDHRADIFSFGVLAYELVSREKPFTGGSISELFYQISHEEPIPLREVAPDGDPELAGCIERCLEKDRDDRYADFDEVLGALESVGASPADEPAAWAAGGLGRRGAWAALAVLAALAAAFGATRFLGGSEEATGKNGVRATAAAGSTTTADTAVRGAGARAAAGGSAARAVDAAATRGEAVGSRSEATGPAGSAGGGATDGATGAGTAGAGAGDDRPAADGAPDAGVASTQRATGDRGGTDRQGARAATPEPTSDGGGAAEPPPAAGVLVVVRGEDAPGHQAVEDVLLRELGDAGFEVADRTSLELQALAGGGEAEPGALGRRAGTAVVVLARYRGQATRSVGASYTGSATLSVRSYDTRTGELLDSETFRVGGGGTPGEAGSTPAGAATKAAEKVGFQAAFALKGLLRPHLGAASE